MNSFSVFFIRVFSLLIFLQIFTFSNLTAQIVPDREEVEMLFENKEKMHWVRYYQGEMDNMHDVVIAIGYDGKNYKGLLSFQRSEELFMVFGKFQDNGVLELEEVGANGKTSAYITGLITDKTINADWENARKTISGSMSLKVINEDDIRTHYCGSGKWIYGYGGTFGSDKVKILLQKQMKSVITGYIYFKNEDLSYKLKGEQIKGSEDFAFSFFDEKEVKIGVIKGKIKTNGRFIGKFTKKDQPEYSFVLDAEQKLQVTCIEFADYTTVFTAVYPSMQSQNEFSEFIFGQVKGWLGQTRKQTLDFLVSKAENNPEDRLSIRAYSWFEVAHVSDKIISGYLVGNDTWQGSYRKAFNFDVESKQAVIHDDLFIETPDFKEFVQAKIKETLKEKPYFEETEFQSWYAEQAFDLITIKQEGIEFSSGSNPLYGAQFATIKYDLLKQYLKTGNPLEHLYSAEEFSEGSSQ